VHCDTGNFHFFFDFLKKKKKKKKKTKQKTKKTNKTKTGMRVPAWSSHHWMTGAVKDSEPFTHLDEGVEWTQRTKICISDANVSTRRAVELAVDRMHTVTYLSVRPKFGDKDFFLLLFSMLAKCEAPQLRCLEVRLKLSAPVGLMKLTEVLTRQKQLQQLSVIFDHEGSEDTQRLFDAISLLPLNALQVILMSDSQKLTEQLCATLRRLTTLKSLSVIPPPQGRLFPETFCKMLYCPSLIELAFIHII
jgi:hypothetical protein